MTIWACKSSDIPGADQQQKKQWGVESETKTKQNRNKEEKAPGRPGGGDLQRSRRMLREDDCPLQPELYHGLCPGRQGTGVTGSICFFMNASQ